MPRRSGTPEEPRTGPRDARSAYRWFAVACSMALVVGVWAVGIRARVHQDAAEATDPAIHRAFSDLFRSVQGLRTGAAAFRPGTATSTPSDTLIQELKQKIIEMRRP